MKKQIRIGIVVVMILGLLVGGVQATKKAIAAPQRPSDADLMPFKVYHHAVYMVTTAKQAGGTNKLFHTTELPTEGTDPVVTPALDHLYTKAIIDLTNGQ